MKNVTVTMDDDLARWARIEAAKRGRSVSRFLTDTLAELRAAGGRTELEEEGAALERFLTGPGFPGAAAAWPGSEALYAGREDKAGSSTRTS